MLLKRPSFASFTLAALIALAALIPTAPATAGFCSPTPSTLCLRNGLYLVEIDWEDGVDQGQGQPLATVLNDDTGFLSYADSGAAEIMVKVLDGCALNGRNWIFLTGISPFGQTIRVSTVGSSETYSNAEGTVGPNLLDLDTSLPCPGLISPAPEAAPLRGGGFSLAGRFLVDVEYEDNQGTMGAGTPVSLTDRSAYVWLFSANNPEMLLKMVGNEDTDFFEFSAGTSTNLSLQMTITDTCSGAVRVYAQQQGTTTSFIDPQAFPLACASSIFQDGFESGNIDAWSSSP